MKKKQYTHPMILYPQRIKEEGIVVFNDARGLPFGDSHLSRQTTFKGFGLRYYWIKKSPENFGACGADGN
ncbi:MAG: hypothetical protein IKO75_06705 [Bacteroidales bacterium]|nr:hypothetical protein [Bacteroidales bacterium]